MCLRNAVSLFYLGDPPGAQDMIALTISDTHGSLSPSTNITSPIATTLSTSILQAESMRTFTTSYSMASK